jgi:hypothetical protein
MIGSNDYPPEPPSEIRQDRSPVRGGELAEERRRNGIIRAEPLFHVEVCGSEKFDYDYRRKIFDKNGYRVIFVHLYKDEGKWKQHLLQYLYVFTNNRNQKMNKIFRENNLVFGEINKF